MKIAYEKHPVTPERKAELNKQGFRVIDAKFKPADFVEPEAVKPRKARKAKASDNG